MSTSSNSFVPARRTACLGLALAGFAAFLSGCGGDSSEDGLPRFLRGQARFVRLLERMDAASVGGMDALDRVALADANAAPLEERIVPANDAEHVIRSDSLWRFLERDAALDTGGETPPIALMVFALPDDRPVRLQVEPTAGSTPRVFCFRTQRRADSVDTSGAIAAERVVRTGAKQMFWLEPGATRAPDESLALEAALDRDPQFPTAVVGLIGAANARVRIVGDSNLGARLRQMRIRGAPDHVARVAIANDARESVLLPPPAWIEWKMDLPAGAIAITGAVGQFFGAEPSPSELAISVRADDDVVGAAATATAQGWSPFRVDCAQLAGRAVKIRVQPVQSTAAQARICALAEPRIVLAAPDPIVSPDVLLVSLDTMRFDADRLAGDGISATPALRALEREAVVFDQATVASSWTLPSHAAAFTGLYPDRLGTTTTQSSIPDGARLIAEDFRAAHYDTAAFVSGGFVGDAFGFARGFDRYVDADPVSLERKGRSTDARYTASIARSENSRREALQWVESGSALDGPPGFVFLHTYAAHGYDAPDAVRLEFGATPQEVETMQAGAVMALLEALLRARNDGEREHARRVARLSYASAARITDDLLADVIAARAKRTSPRPLVLVVFSDHGEELGEHGFIGHGHALHDELVRVPWLIAAPGLAARRVSDAVSLVDLAPTLRDWFDLGAGASPWPHDGRSVLPHLAGLELPPRPSFARTDDRDTVYVMLRTSKSKLILRRRAGIDATLQWFDLVADPGETKDRALDDPAGAARARARVEQFADSLERIRGAGAAAAMTEQAREQLQQLGYLGDD
ncbi:MAG: sulfatase-like hydrolase/transferase [Planctomycetes bacterium]|nr:sulfatase-like hydrolase/transferase [Planctomycetota bacterium]